MTARVDDDDDFKLVSEPRRSARARRGPAAGRRGTVRRWAWLGWLTRRPARTIAGAVISALLTSIVINALVLQKAKHPAPFFMPSVPLKAVEPAHPPLLRPAPIRMSEPAQPVAKSAAVEAAPPATKPKDAIAGLITGETAPAKPKDVVGALIKETVAAPAEDAVAPPPERVMAVQQALVRLGFVLHADGVLGAATRQAIELFERDHGMPADGDLSPRLTRQLAEMSGIAIP